MLIRTDYVGPTDDNGSRVVGHVVGDRKPTLCGLSFDHALGVEGNHERVANMILRNVGLDHLSVRYAANDTLDHYYWIVEGEN